VGGADEYEGLAIVQLDMQRAGMACQKRRAWMRKFVTRIALVALVALVVPVAMPGMASAQMREFVGKVDKIDDKKLIVDNRKGDKVSFDKVAETTVEGIKTDWKSIKKDDWVSVSWKMVDKPRKAYKVNVMPPKEEAGEDE
jgi:hypothetical protein